MKNDGCTNGYQKDGEVLGYGIPKTETKTSCFGLRENNSPFAYFEVKFEELSKMPAITAYFGKE